jgi:hypoxanthine phosphoribosyltransferase
MKNVEIVKTAVGTYVTRRYRSQNKGREFFYSVAPASVKTKKREFIKEQQEKKDKYIKEWIDE